MTTVAHLLDDSELGGVTRFLDALDTSLGNDIVQSRHRVRPSESRLSRFEAEIIVVHFTMSWSKLPYLLALRAYNPRRPIVLVEHSYSQAFEQACVRSRQRFRTMLRLAYAAADRVISVSYGQAAWMRRERLLPAHKILVIRPFTDCLVLSKLPPPASHAGPLRLGAYGRYRGQKDFATLVMAMRNVDPSVATLALRGFGPDAEPLRALAAALPHVSVGDQIDDLGEFLGTTDAIVVPSMFEPFGQVALEARLAARPAIVSAVDGLPEQVDPSFGIVVPPADPCALAASIAGLARFARTADWPAACERARNSAIDHPRTNANRWRNLILHLQPPCGIQQDTLAVLHAPAR